MTQNCRIFPSEWQKQSGVLLSWPHKCTDWHYMLSEVQNCFYNIAKAIIADEKLIIVAPCVDDVKTQLNDLDQSRISYYEMPTNDTWARDFGAITVFDNGTPLLLNFKFNAWGNKFEWNFDNEINESLSAAGAFNFALSNRKDFVLEGGSIESDGNGTLLTTSCCLLNDERNKDLSQQEIEEQLKEAFGLKKVLWLEHGELAGDDTDGHIDTLARIAPDNTIIYVKCFDTNDEHYSELVKMEAQLATFTNASGEYFKLVPVPLPNAIFDDDGERLPATYANFLIMNNQVLVPIYGQADNDKMAIDAIQQVFPNHKIIGIDCNALIKQHGSLHCVTMQFPENVIK